MRFPNGLPLRQPAYQPANHRHTNVYNPKQVSISLFLKNSSNLQKHMRASGGFWTPNGGWEHLCCKDVIYQRLNSVWQHGRWEKKMLTSSLVSNYRAVQSKGDDLFCFMFITSTSSSTFICSNHLIEMHLIHSSCCSSSFPALHEDGNHRPQTTDVMTTLIITPCARSDPHVTWCILKQD